MKYGLTETTVEKIRAVFARFREVEKAVLYGSRAKGNFKPGSDIDLTLYGEALTSDLRSAIASALDDLLLPYTVDLSIFDELDHAKLREHIERVGVLFYERANQGAASGWKLKKLSQVCEKITDGTHQTPTYFDEGFLFLSSRNVTSGKIDWENVKYIDSKQHADMQKRVSPRLNDILLAKNGTTGVAAIVDKEIPFDIYVSLALLRPLDDVLPRFLLYFLNSPIAKEQFTERLKGIGVPNLHLEEIREVEISYPESKAEQQRIVGILDEAFEGIATAKAKAEKNLQNAHALFESHLQSVFTQRGKGWMEKSLGELATFRNGINYTKDSKGERIKIVGVRNFQKHFSAPLDDLDTVTIDGKLSELDSLKQDDILAVRSNGNIELIGRCILVGEVTEEISHSGFTIRIRLTNGSVLPKYVCHFMKSAGSRKLLTEGGTGTNIKSLNQGMLSALAIPFPPISAQQVLVEQLDSLSEETQRLESIYKRKLDTLEALKKSLLNEAFTGKL